jgi:glycosyltransferase involved in cell wall biosynthesis
VKIAIISEYNIYTTIGGTEYYVDMLIHSLCAGGNDLILITKGKQTDKIEYKKRAEKGKEFSIFFLPSLINTKPEIEQKIVSSSWHQMEQLLKEFQPDIIHVHTFTTFFNIRHFELCIKQFSPIIFTSHIPGHFCPRGDLIQNGKRPCDGKISLKCTICLFSKSLKTGTSNLLFGYVHKKLRVLEQLNAMKIQIVCVANWQKEQLVRNGYDEINIHIIRQALITSNYKNGNERIRKKKFSIGYLGRLSPEKGSVLLLKLIRRLKESPDLRFVLGIPENSDQAELKRMKRLLVESKVDIQLLSTVQAGNKEEFFNEVDCLLIPSFCIETGPIVLLESIFYHKKVIAPDIGGPLEYASEFPDEVFTYAWNNLDSIITVIGKIKKYTENTFDNHRLHLMSKEKKFLADHVIIYKQLMPTI